MKDNHYPVIIIGSGMAGLGASISLQKRGIKNLIIEKANSVGGLCSSFELAGCRFDIGPKILILDESENSQELLSYLDGNYDKHPVNESVYLSDYGYLSFPLQRNLIDLPEEKRAEILADIQDRQLHPQPVHSFRDWLANSYGEKFCELVLFPYEEKKWQVGLDKMDYAWALDRPVKVDLDDVLQGAKQKLPPNKSYYYPRNGDISTLTKAMAKQAGEIFLNKSIAWIDHKKKEIMYIDKVSRAVETVSYDYLISSAPLDYFIEATLHLLPRNLDKRAPKTLKRLAISVVNLVFEGEHDLKGTALYFPEKKYIFRRVSVLSNLCPALKKPGFTTIQVEISTDPKKKVNPTRLIARTLKDLGQIELFKDKPRLLKSNLIDIPFAYPLQVNGLREFVKEVHDYYEKFGIYHIGRGGRYDYCNSDLAYKQGRQIGNQIKK